MADASGLVLAGGAGSVAAVVPVAASALPSAPAASPAAAVAEDVVVVAVVAPRQLMPSPATTRSRAAAASSAASSPAGARALAATRLAQAILSKCHYCAGVKTAMERIWCDRGYRFFIATGTLPPGCPGDVQSLCCVIARNAGVMTKEVVAKIIKTRTTDGVVVLCEACKIGEKEDELIELKRYRGGGHATRRSHATAIKMSALVSQTNMTDDDFFAGASAATSGAKVSASLVCGGYDAWEPRSDAGRHHCLRAPAVSSPRVSLLRLRPPRPRPRPRPRLSPPLLLPTLRLPTVVAGRWRSTTWRGSCG